MRDLKTTPFGVLLFGHPKTKNILTTRAKEQAAERDEKFDRSSDPYRHCYELLPLTATIDSSLLARVDEVVAGEGPDGDGASTVCFPSLNTVRAGEYRLTTAKRLVRSLHLRHPRNRNA